jgi:hypothetical protein
LGSITGKRKAHSSAVARKAAMARWEKRRVAPPLIPQEELDRINWRSAKRTRSKSVAAASDQTGGTPPAPPAAARRGAP